MKKIITLLFLLLITLSARASDVIGYLPNYRMNETTLKHTKHCTDIVYFGSEIAEDGSIILPDQASKHLRKLADLALENDTRLHLCLGGWAKDKHFPVVTASPTKRKKFLSQLDKLVTKYHLKGVDYDWEYPRTKDEMTNFVKLCTETKRALGKHFIVTAAFHPSHKIPKTLTDALDRIHLMTYDLAGNHCDIAHAKKAIHDWRKSGVPNSKICIGAAFYSRKTDERNKVKTYQQMIAEHGNAVATQMPYAGYFGDNKSSCKAKVKLIKEEKIRGLIIWEIGQDAARKESLLSTIEESFK